MSQPLQRRARLARKTKLRRTPIARTRPKPRRTPTRSTGPTSSTRELVRLRAGGRCEICGSGLDGAITSYSYHHRLPRKMGGSTRPWINSPSNLILVCGSGSTGCHGLIERERASAYGYGWLLRDREYPVEVSVVIGAPEWPKRTRIVWLTDDGTYARTAPDA